MQLKDKIEIIEKYICDNFEDWDLDDPIAESYLDDYQEITGASETDIKNFEEKFKISLLRAFPDYFTSEDIESMQDSRIKPYLFNKSWFPIA